MKEKNELFLNSLCQKLKELCRYFLSTTMKCVTNPLLIISKQNFIMKNIKNDNCHILEDYEEVLHKWSIR